MKSLAELWGNREIAKMKLREHFAGLAMQGLLADHKDHDDEVQSGETCEQCVARLAVKHADALLEELVK